MNIRIVDFDKWAKKHKYIEGTSDFLKDLKDNYAKYDLKKNSQDSYRHTLNKVIKEVIWKSPTESFPPDIDKYLKTCSVDMESIDDDNMCYSLLKKYKDVYLKSGKPESKLLTALYDNYSNLDTLHFFKMTEKDVSSLDQIEREAVIKTRIGQGAFRNKLIKKHGPKCAMCDIKGEAFLTASHIKPWRDISDEFDKATNDMDKKIISAQLTDENNGILLCPNHDHLFDKGYISFDPNHNGKIMISSELNSNPKTMKQMISDPSFELGNTIKPLTKEMKKYLTHHNVHVYKN